MNEDERDEGKVHKDVVDGDVDQFHEESDGAHDDESNTDGLRDLEEFLLVGCIMTVSAFHSQR